MTPSWDLFVIIFFIVAVVFGVALGRERAVVGVIASYMGLVAANIGGNALYAAMGGSTTTQIGSTLSITATTSPFIVKAIIFILITLLLIVKGDFLKKASTIHEGFGSIIFAAMYSFLNAGLIITAIISFLNDAQRTDLLTQSHWINEITQYQIWWMVLPIILMVLLGFKKSGGEE
ncbi:hypothetical protein HYV44_01890 [Candidatus Microgenomates bacterium]|nr:hypothetical protein [Candidatus Microgenomates bacterium]